MYKGGTISGLFNRYGYNGSDEMHLGQILLTILQCGVGPVLYLTMNATLRERALTMLGWRKIHRDVSVSNLGVSSIIRCGRNG